MQLTSDCVDELIREGMGVGWKGDTYTVHDAILRMLRTLKCYELIDNRQLAEMTNLLWELKAKKEVQS